MTENDECTCDYPCCEVDIGVGFVTCGEQHCAEHATADNQGVPSYRTYGEGALYGMDVVQGWPTGVYDPERGTKQKWPL